MELTHTIFSRLANISLTLLFVLMLSTSANASLRISASSILHSKKNVATNPSLPRATYFSADTSELTKLFSGNVNRFQLENFPISATEFVTLDLKSAHSVFDARTLCIVAGPEGDFTFTIPEFHAFRGAILCRPNSKVFITYSACGLLCSITLEDETKIVLGQSRTSTDATDYILLPETDLLASQKVTPFNCLNDGIAQPRNLTPVDELLKPYRTQLGGKSQIQKVNQSGLLEAEVAVEADNDFYTAAGGTNAKVVSYIGSLFSMSSAIFEDEAHISLRVPWVKVWATADPYQVHGNAYAMPDLVRAYWGVHYKDVQRDLAHVMTSISYGGGGFGYYSLCDTAYSYSVSSPQTGKTYPTFAFSYDSYIVSHEIGHNFGSPHTHDCYWNPELDTCLTKDDPNTSLRAADACHALPITARKNPGTIMSYCANTNYALSGNNFAEYKLVMTFSKKPDSVIRATVEKASCITAPSAPTVVLTSPRGSTTFSGDSTTAIQWASAHLTTVSLEYSSNGGTSWNPIASSLQAADCNYNWKMPNISSTQMLVRIFDATHASPAEDTSLLFFTINSTGPNPAYKTLTLAGVSAGKINANTPTHFNWTSEGAVGVGTIQYSTDHTIWSDIVTVQESETTANWTTPDINIPQAYFKIINKKGLEYEAPNPVWIFKQNQAVRVSNGIPTSFYMTPNFPNPVTSTTSVQVDVPRRSTISLSVCNETRVTVEKLANEILDAGSYVYSLDVKNLANGNYLFVLESGTTRLMGKMQVQK
ncbi:MAG: M12 family metallo-peptidase [bacterium]